MDLKDIVKGSATLNCMLSGGIAVYDLCSESGKIYQVNIDLSDKHDVGDTAIFQPHYDKALILMRWIRKAIDNDKLYIIKE